MLDRRGALIGIVVASVVAACRPPRAPNTARDVADDVAIRVRIANAEAERGGALGELLALASIGKPPVRVLAIRALGRIGGDRATSALTSLVGDPEIAIVGAAAGALGVASALDRMPAAQQHAASDALMAASSRPGLVRDDLRTQLVEALGRAGDPAAQAIVARELTASPELAVTAANALARFGRRKLALDAGARAALITATSATDARVRAAAVGALAREQQPPALAPDDSVVAALVARVADPDGDVRAQAIAGLARHAAVDHARDAIGAALQDRDWRVAVEAVRALAGEHGDDAGRQVVAAALRVRIDPIVHAPATAHIVIEALHLLGGAGALPAVAKSLDGLVDAGALSGLPTLAHAWIACLVRAVQMRAAPHPSLLSLSACSRNLPDHLRLPLVAEVAATGVDDYMNRRRMIGSMLDDSDARVRAAALGVLADLWKESPRDDRAAWTEVVIAALAVDDPVVAGASVDAAESLDKLLADAPDLGDERAKLDAAVIARATRETEPELGAALLELIGKRGLLAGDDACRRGLARHPVIARAAASCISALHPDLQPHAPAVVASPLPPNIDVASVIGKDVRWHVVTDRGPIEIVLRPDVAPWAVATIVALTRRGFYDNLEFHRVVPNFVLQGGDPTMSGAGGPGFTIPAEPATHADGAGFATGGVGIADSGPDSGGSQWFIMHSAAPHLDGRYTWVGVVTSGQDIADALLVGDKVVSATVDVH